MKLEFGTVASVLCLFVCLFCFILLFGRTVVTSVRYSERTLTTEQCKNQLLPVTESTSLQGGIMLLQATLSKVTIDCQRYMKLYRLRFFIVGNYIECLMRCNSSFFQPEWYFTQVLNWIKNHSDFLQHTIQPILHRTDYDSVDAKVLNKFIIILLSFVQSPKHCNQPATCIYSLPEFQTVTFLFFFS